MIPVERLCVIQFSSKNKAGEDIPTGLWLLFEDG